MNTKLLKQKILDLAIRGKLTQQLESDGTAADLLKEICDRTQEKTSLRAKRGNPSPQTIIPLDKSEAPFEVPANWEWVRLGDYLDVRDGTHDSPKYVECGYPFVTSKNLINGTIDFSNCKQVSKQDFEKIEERSHVDDGDILYAMIGSIGNPVLVKKTCDFAIKNVALFKKRDTFTNMHFVFYWLQFVEKDLKVNAAGGLQPFVSLSMFRERCFPLPPLAEQQRIVAKIEDAFAEIDAVEKNKELLKTHIKQTRQKFLDLAIHGKLVPQDENDEPAGVLLERITRDNPHYEKIEDEPFEIPENWAWVRINDIASDMADGPFGSNLKAEHYTDKKEARIIQLSNIAENGWKDENVRYTTFEHAKKNISRSIVEAGNLVIAKMMPAGRAMICPSTEKMYVLSSDAVKLVPIDEINNQFLCYAINSPYFKAQVNGNIQGTTRLRTSISKLRECLLALPPLAEQARIVAKIEELFSTLDQMERNLI